MGRRDRDRIRTWAERVVSEHGSAVARLIGVDPPLPPVTIDVDPAGPPGVTGGLTITLSERWFREHPDDVGCVLHELTHAYMRAPDYDASTIWLIEGIADHVRDELGFDTSWTSAHFEPGKATAGYQTTADLLACLEERRPGAVVMLSRLLADGSYRETASAEVIGAPLSARDDAYEADGTRPAPRNVLEAWLPDEKFPAMPTSDCVGVSTFTSGLMMGSFAMICITRSYLSMPYAAGLPLPNWK